MNTPLRDRIQRTEATCQGCRQCKWGGTFPCPSQTADWRKPAWLARLTAKEMLP